MPVMEEKGTKRQRRTMFGNAKLPLLEFDFHYPAFTLREWFNVVAGYIPNDSLGPLTSIPATPSLPADTINSGCGILFSVPGWVENNGISSLHFICAPIDYQAGKSATAIYGTIGSELAMMHYYTWKAISLWKELQMP